MKANGWLVFTSYDILFVASNTQPSYDNFCRNKKLFGYSLTGSDKVYDYLCVSKSIEVYDLNLKGLYKVGICPVSITYNNTRDGIYDSDTSFLKFECNNSQMSINYLNYFDYGNIEINIFSKKDSINFLKNNEQKWEGKLPNTK